ncbi:hypothetical protein QTP86_011846 [Hemibagrus guttatus]|nr:hypothetical protein QTP86_011846 [Hemibagrus guttatus]
MLYGLETVSLRKRQESELEVAELKMLREPATNDSSDSIYLEEYTALVISYIGKQGDKMASKTARSKLS